MGFGAEDALFNSILDFNFRKKLVTATFGAQLCMVLKLGP